MSNAAIKAALDSSVESASDLLVLVLLADHLNGKTGLCCPSIPLLAEECRRDERSIFRALKRLEEQGHISRDSGRGVGHSNRYRIHPKGQRKRRAKSEPDTPFDEAQNLTPVSPFEDGEKVTNQTVKPDASVMQKVTELVSKPDTSVTLTRSNQKLTGNEPEVAPIESADASSHFALHEPVHVEPRTKKTNLSKGSLDEIMAFCKEVGLFPRDAEYLFHKWEGCGWKNGKASIKNWQATIRAWKAQGYLPSQKSPSASDCWPSAQIQVEAEEEEDLLAKMLRRKAEKEEQQRLAEGEPPEIVDGDSWGDEDATPSQPPSPSKDSTNETEAIANEVVHDDEALALLRRLSPPSVKSAPPTTPPEPEEEDHEEDLEPYTEEELFDHFEKTMWELYPSARKSIDQRPDFTRMLRDIPAESRTQAWKALKAWNHSPNWNNDGGKFVPNVLKFLVDKRWTHPPKTGSSDRCSVSGY